ncbi:hypothetical protein CHELA40_12134 [Chelatococcus asaccharovorans]|nr:hypothetical protein CHELA40_12134 [Chelatococcus asaccharovorans]
MTPKSFSMPLRSFSIAAASPKPLITTLAPSLARARATASPIPLVDPVTTAVRDFSDMMLLLRENQNAIVRQGNEVSLTMFAFLSSLPVKPYRSHAAMQLQSSKVLSLLHKGSVTGSRRLFKLPAAVTI